MATKNKETVNETSTEFVEPTSASQIDNNQPETSEIDTTTVQGSVSGLYIAFGYADADRSTWSKGLTGELACKDAHFTNAVLPFGNEIILQLTEVDGTIRKFTALQLLGYIPKDAEDYKANLKNKSNLSGGINANFGRASEENKKESFSWQFITEFNFKMPTKLPRKPLNAVYTGSEFKKDCNSLYLYLSDLDSPWRMLPAKDGKSVDFV